MPFLRLCTLCFLFFSIHLLAAAQQAAPVIANPKTITLSVVVDDKSGNPVAGLQQQDFTLLDNKSPHPISSFKAVTAGQEPVYIILVVDDITTPFSKITYIRDALTKFLRANQGQLRFPTTIAVATETSMSITTSFSNDGNTLADTLAHATIGLRPVTSNSGAAGASQLLQDDLNDYGKLMAYCSKVPGRKIVIWFAPGWPLMPGTRMSLDGKQKDTIFHQVMMYSAQTRDVNMTLYDINPLGEAGNQFLANYYRGYIAGVSHAYDAQVADLSLQVQTTHSGGLVMNASSDVGSMLADALHDLDNWYDITFEVPPAKEADEYHHLEIKLAKPGLTARTRDSYYIQPTGNHLATAP